MLRQEYLRRLVDGAHIELHLSSNDGARLYWPWRMQPPKEASQAYRDACEQYVIDSDPLDNDVTAKDVLDTAHRLDAEVASLQDVYQDKDATVDSLLKGLEVADDHAFDGTLLLPLQAPYVECWRDLGEPRDYWLGIGGLKDARPNQRLTAAGSLRDATGPDAWIHGFGWGVTGIASKIRENPNLLDSLDYSTPLQQSVISDCTPGKERMSVTAMGAAKRLVKDLREVSEYPDKEQTIQTSLGG
ncbi:DpdA [Halorubrum tailed virus 29]|uniref:DpdA n=1 Tax=Halorubrum tailed virus 29 TaxID=2878010 RepID=A0AAE8XZG2_9CAUD|nr:DpdA [Halorubrum tailed virus 29]UBF23311.1 DpdA [Halorubrum tailed virus 29]